MLYYNDKQIALVRLDAPHHKAVNISKEKDMLDILQTASKNNCGEIYHYVGPTTEQYVYDGWYKLIPEITISKSDINTPSFNIYDGMSNTGMLLATINDTEEVVVPCATGYLYFEIVKDSGGYFKNYEALGQESTEIITINGGINKHYWCVQIDQDKAIHVDTDYPTVTVTSAGTNICPILIYDGETNLSNLVSTLEAYPDYNTYAEISVKSRYLNVVLIGNEDYPWFSNITYSENIKTVSPQHNSLMFMVLANGTIHIKTSDHYDGEE